MTDGHNTDTNQKVPPDWRGIARELATALIIVSDEAELLLREAACRNVLPLTPDLPTDSDSPWTASGLRLRMPARPIPAARDVASSATEPPPPPPPD